MPLKKLQVTKGQQELPDVEEQSAGYRTVRRQNLVFGVKETWG